MAAEKNGFRSKYPSRCGTDGQNMFLDGGHKFPGPPVAACWALSPHLEHDLTGREKGNGDIREKHAGVAGDKPTLSPLDSAAHTMPNRKGIRERGQRRVPRAETIHNTCFASD